MSKQPIKRHKTSSDSRSHPTSKVMEADDSMASTTPSSNGNAPAENDFEDDNLFPGASNPSDTVVRPQTPQNDHLNAAAPGELSPPRSQTQDTRPATNGHYTADDIDMGITEKVEQKQEDAPGMGWKSKKAQEEMHRAWEYVVDKDFSLKEFGDVIMIGKQQRGEK